MPTGFHIASAWVDIRAEDRGLRGEVRSAVENAARGQNIKVNVKINDRGLRTELTRALRAAERGQALRLPVRINSRGLRAELNRAMRVATAGQGVKIPVRLNTVGLRREVARAARAASIGQRIRVPVRASSVGLRAQVSRIARAAAIGQRIRIPVHARSAGLRAEVTRAVRIAQAGQRIVIPVRADTSQLRRQGIPDIRRFSNTGTRAMRRLTWGGAQAANSVLGISRIGFRSIASTAPGAAAVAVGGLQLIGVAAQASAAILGAAMPIAFIAMGTAALWQTRKVQRAFKRMSHHLSTSIRRAAMPMQRYLVKGMRQVSRAARKMEPQLRRAFKAAGPLIKPLVRGITGLARAALPGLTRALRRSKPLMKGFADGMTKIGRGIGQMFDEMTKNGGAKAIGNLWRVIGEGIRKVLKELGRMFRVLAKDKDAVKLLEQGFDLLVITIRIITFLIRALAKAASWLTNPLKAVTDILGFFWNIGKKITSSPIVMKAKDWVTKKAKQAWNWLKKIAGKVARAVMKAKDWVTRKAKQAWNWLKKIAGKVARAVMKAKDWVTKKAKQAWNWLKKIAGKVAKAVMKAKDWVTRKAKGAWNWLKRIAGKVAKAILKAKDWVTRKAKQAWRWLQRIARKVARAVLKAADWISGKAKAVWRWLQRIAGKVARAVLKAADWVTGKAKRAWNWLTKIAGKVARAVLRAVDNITSVAKRVVNWLGKIVSKTITIGIDLVGDAVGKIGDLLGFRKGGVVRFASGGNVQGPGTGTSDSILARVSNGEFVMRADAVERFGVPFMNSMNQGMLSPENVIKGLANGQIPGFASGGPVSGGPGGGLSSTGSSSGATGSAPSAPVEPSVTDTRNGARASLTASDDTGPAILSATARFEQFKKAVDLTYQGINRSSIMFGIQQKLLLTQIGNAQRVKWSAGLRHMSNSSKLNFNNITRATQMFGVRQKQRLALTSAGSQRIWTGWRLGMQKRTDHAMDTMARRTNTWGRFTQTRFRNTRSGTHKIWTGWRTGMQGRTDKAMDNMRKRVQRGGNQVERRFRGTRSTSHKIWTNWRTGMQGRTDKAMDNMRKRVQRGGNQMEGRLRGSRSTTHKIWTNWRTGMQGRTDKAMDNMRKRVQRGGNQMEGRLRGTRSTTHKIWTNWRTGMQGRTDKATDNMRKRIGRFKKQATHTFRGASKSVGKAWNRVRPKLAAPIKYLTGKVINKGVVPAMNKVVSQLGGSAKLKKVSTGGFASGGYVSGPGSGTSDDIPARLSNGEYVIRASSVRKYGVGYLNAVNHGMATPNAAPIRRAMGGLVGTANKAGNSLMGFAKGGLAAVTGAGKNKLQNMMGQYMHKDYEQLANWIWETAINPLVNRAPGGRMMDAAVKAASERMRKNAVKWLEANIFPMGAAVGFRPGPPWKPGDGQRVRWRGVTVNRRTRGMLIEADRRFKKGRINPTQGSYSTRVAASGSTHAGGGAVDMGPAKDALVWALRGSGFAAWRRRPSQGPWGPHIHAIAAGDPTASASAKAQVRQFFKGMNGLGGPDLFGGGGRGGSGVMRWRGLAIKAMKMAGLRVTGYRIGRFLDLMRAESNGNPRAMNNWDSNARAGNASRGLMQVIPSTFRANHVKGTSWNIFDPLANMAAAARYIKRRYGGRIPNSPYAEGGPVMGPGTGTSDTIPAMLSDGEFVMRAAAVKKYGKNFMSRVNEGVLGMAQGGKVKGSPVKGVPRYLGPEYFVHANKFAKGGPVGHFASGGMVRDDNGNLIPTDHKDVFGDSILTVGRGDTLSEIARRWSTTVEDLVKWNRINNKDLIYVGEQLRVISKDNHRYQIQQGDTLSEIAAANGTTVEELLRLNRYIKDADRIFAGRWLTVPGSAGGGGSDGGGTPAPPKDFWELPPYVFPRFRTTKPEQFVSDETKKALTQMVYVPWEQKLAGMNESKVVGALKAQENLETLINNIADLKATVRAAFKGDDTDVHQKDMIDRIHLSTEHLQKWQKKLDAGAAAFEAATQEVENLQSSFNSLRDSTTDTIKSFGAITKIGTWGTNVSVLTNQLVRDIQMAEDFAGSLDELRARGVNSTMIGDIVEAGLTGGGLATAHTLLRASPEEIARLNDLQAQLNDVAQRTGAAAAEGMYGAGLQAAQGLLAGLEAERDQIEEYMMMIAKAMEKSIKQALGIKSPSKVFMEVGEMATLGMVHGMGSRISDVVHASRGVANAAVTGVTSPSSHRGAVAGSGNVYNINVNIDGTWDLTNRAERQHVAAMLVREMKEEIRKDDRRRR